MLVVLMLVLSEIRRSVFRAFVTGCAMIGNLGGHDFWS